MVIWHDFGSHWIIRKKFFETAFLWHDELTYEDVSLTSCWAEFWIEMAAFMMPFGTVPVELPSAVFWTMWTAPLMMYTAAFWWTVRAVKLMRF